MLDDVYLQGYEKPEHIYASPILDDFHDLPPTLLAFGEHDFLAFEDFAYARHAVKAGVQLKTIVYRGLGHGFADYPISLALYHPDNPLARLLAGFGEYPAALGLSAAGAMLLSARNREKWLTGVLQTVAGCLSVLLGGAMAAVLSTGYLDIPVWLAALIGVGCTGLTVWGTLLLCRGADRGIVLRAAGTFLLVIFADILVVNLIKIPWGRPRMRLVAGDARACFMPWWQPGTELRDALVAAGVAASRVVMGAHYLSDTAVGLAVGLAAMTAVCRLLFPVKRGAETPFP